MMVHAAQGAAPSPLLVKRSPVDLALLPSPLLELDELKKKTDLPADRRLDVR